MAEQRSFPQVVALATVDSPDAELVSLARADDKYAFNLLMERYQLMALCIALRIEANEETARELVQEAMLQAYLSLDHLRDEARFKSWFYGIVLNICRNWRRMQKPVTFSLDTPAGNWRLETAHFGNLYANPHALLEEQELQDVLHAAIAILSPRNRIVAQLFYYENLSVQEIAHTLNISLAAVKNRLHKGREQLRSTLSTSYPDLAYMTTRKARKETMIKVTLAKTVVEGHRTLVILLAEQQQRVLPLWIKSPERLEPTLRMRESLQKDALPVAPLTLDFIVNLVNATGSSVESVNIDALQEDILYAQVLLSSQSRQHKIKAHINDALALALRLESVLYVADEVLAQLGTDVSTLLGNTQDERLDIFASKISKTPYLLSSEQALVTSTPCNLDFTDGLRGWWFLGHPREVCEYHIDHEIKRSTTGSLALSVGQADPLSMGSLHHEGFLADNYRGKRLQLLAYIKTADVKMAMLILQTFGANKVPQADSTKSKRLLGTTDWTRYELVMDVPTNASAIQLSFNLTGQGKAWLDLLQINTVDNSVPLTDESVTRFPRPDQPQNTHFAHKLAEWDLLGSHPQDYTAGIDMMATQHGTPGAYLASAVAAPRGYGQLRQMINAKRYMDKRMRLTGRIKAANVEQQANLYLHMDGIGVNKVQEKSLQGTTDWTEYSVELYVPEGQITHLNFGVSLYGRGRVWLEYVHLEVIDEKTSSVI